MKHCQLLPRQEVFPGHTSGTVGPVDIESSSCGGNPVVVPGETMRASAESGLGHAIGGAAKDVHRSATGKPSVGLG
jgi:hypothetical protein